MVCGLQANGNGATVPDGSVSLVLLAGGVGKRMGVRHAPPLVSVPPPALCMAASPQSDYPVWALLLPGRLCWLTLFAMPISLRYRPPPIPQASIPKQYLELRGQPIATYSMQMFAAMPQVPCGVAVICFCLHWELSTSCQCTQLCPARRLPAALLSNAL